MAPARPGYDEEEEREDRFFIAGFDNVGIKRDQYRSNELRRKALITGGIVAATLVMIGLLFGLVVLLRRHTSLEYECPNTGDFSSSPDLVFFVVGDWGRQGKASQQTAARMMQLVGQNCMKPAFIISTGDNFYDNGLRSSSDPQFAASFTSVYTGSTLQVPWYSVLGNHDYALSLDVGDASLTSSSCQGGLTTGCYSPLWQVGAGASLLNAQDVHQRWHCQQGAIVRTFLGGLMDIFFIDTNPFISRYHTMPGANVTGGVSSQNPLAQLILIDALLANSTATWKIVVGHHPVYSYGEHCATAADCTDMQAVLKPLLAKYQVDAYFNGHDHDMQLIRMPNDPTTYVVSGAGSDVRTGEFDGISTGDATEAFLVDDQGFVAAVVRGLDMTLYFYASKSKEVAWEVTIHG